MITDQTPSSSWKRSFLTIVIGQTFSLIGSSAAQFALIWWLASETGSPLLMAFSGLLAFLPQLLLGPFAGVWIDRWPRKYVTISADLFIGLVALAFAGYFHFAQPPYWSACLVLGLRAIGSVFHTPAIQAIVPLLVPREELVRANGWSQFMQSGAFMLGPVLGAALYAVLPLYAIMIFDFVGAVIASLCMAVINVPEVPMAADRTPHFFSELRAGAAIFVQDKRLLTTTLAATICMVFFLPLSSYYPLMSSSHFNVSALHGSLVEFLYAAGMMGSALLISTLGDIRRKFLVVQLGLVGIGITSIIAGLLPAQMWAFWVFAIVCAFMGASGNVYNIPYMAYLQETVPPEALGRVFSLIGSLMSLAMPVGLLISGPIAEKYGVPLWFLVTGIMTLAATAINALILKQLDPR